QRCRARRKCPQPPHGNRRYCTGADYQTNSGRLRPVFGRRIGPFFAQSACATIDAQSLPFADREFDVAAMALVISFVRDASKAVAEMQRVVKQHGTVAAYMPLAPHRSG